MNYYDLLGISNNATEEEIKKAYKAQMKKWHPDINKDKDAVSMSMKINEAKDILLDEIKRKEYDDFLKHKETNTYEKYSGTRRESKSPYNYSGYENKTVTKWEYLREYLNSKNIKTVKKIVSLILVSIESFFCFILKWFIIGLAFISFLLSDIIMITFYYIYPIIVLLTFFLIYILVSSGVNGLINNHLVELKGLIIVIIVYVSSFVLTLIGKKLISQKVFNFLYNKLDIYLFKKAVFYR